MSNDEVQIEGNATCTLPDGMTQEEADRLVREADEAQAERTRRYEAGEELD